MIRPAAPADAAAIRRVHVEAFEGPGEADLVEALEPEVSLVAVAEDEDVVGHVLLSSAWVGEVAVLALAPLGVRPAWQRRGVGKALTRAAVAAARETEFPLVVVLGHPAFYAKLGFEPARRLGLRAPFEAPPEAWRALRLPGWTEDVRGVVRYPEAFGAV